jgi:hypothetical protein
LHGNLHNVFLHFHIPLPLWYFLFSFMYKILFAILCFFNLQDMPTPSYSIICHFQGSTFFLFCFLRLYAKNPHLSCCLVCQYMPWSMFMFLPHVFNMKLQVLSKYIYPVGISHFQSIPPVTR